PWLRRRRWPAWRQALRTAWPRQWRLQRRKRGQNAAWNVSYAIPPEVDADPTDVRTSADRMPSCTETGDRGHSLPLSLTTKAREKNDVVHRRPDPIGQYPDVQA